MCWRVVFFPLSFSEGSCGPRLCVVWRGGCNTGVERSPGEGGTRGGGREGGTRGGGTSGAEEPGVYICSTLNRKLLYTHIAYFKLSKIVIRNLLVPDSIGPINLAAPPFWKVGIGCLEPILSYLKLITCMSKTAVNGKYDNIFLLRKFISWVDWVP